MKKLLLLAGLVALGGCVSSGRYKRDMNKKNDEIHELNKRVSNVEFEMDYKEDTPMQKALKRSHIERQIEHLKIQLGDENK